MSAWSEYRKKLGTTRPWDVVNPSVPKLSDDDAKKRYSICLDCDRFLKVTNQCKECGCFMSIKTRLATASCPIGKW